MVKNKISVLIPSVGKRSTLILELKKNKNIIVHVCNMFSTFAFDIADYSFIVPSIDNPEYIKILIEYCKSNKIDAILPVFDLDALCLSKFKNKFEDIGTKVFTSDESSIAICNDKLKTHEFIKKLDLPTPITSISITDIFIKLIRKKIAFPIIIKARFGTGSIGIQLANNSIELIVLSLRLKKEIKNTYLTKLIPINETKNILYQEFIDGQEHGMDVISDLNGEIFSTIARKKIEMKFGQTFTCETIHSKQIDLIGRKIANNLHSVGILDIDLIKKDDLYYVIDLNPRVGGGFLFSLELGFDINDYIDCCISNKKMDEFNYSPNLILYKELIVKKKLKTSN